MQGSGGFALLSVHLGVRRRWLVNATPLSFPPGNSRGAHFMTLMGTGFGEHKIPFLYQDSKPETSDL